MWSKEKLLVGDLWEGDHHQYLFHNRFDEPYYCTTPSSKWSKLNTN
ncbi:hypothetical protein M1D85_06115 [Bacillus sp. JZ35]